MKFKRIVIKIGTAVATYVGADAPLKAIVAEIAALKKEGVDVILVTSGAIGMGVQNLGWPRKPEEIRKKQAAAAIGQVSLMQTYQELFKEQGLLAAQLLLSRGDFGDRQRYLNARNTLTTLLDLGAVPVINENDTVAVEEIRFGDNDELSSLVASKIDADLLLILTDVEGLYRRGQDGGKELVPLVPKITSDIENFAWSEKSRLGTGGMQSKLEAAKIAAASGVTTVIASAFRKNVVRDAALGLAVGTKFLSDRSLSAKEKWIVFSAVPRGDLVLDTGAVRALQEKNVSLLAAGVLEVRGSFQKGDVVRLKTPLGQEFARGIAGFDSNQIRQIQGLQSGEIKMVLKTTSNSTEVIHRDSLVLLS